MHWFSESMTRNIYQKQNNVHFLDFLLYFLYFSPDKRKRRSVFHLPEILIFSLSYYMTQRRVRQMVVSSLVLCKQPYCYSLIPLFLADSRRKNLIFERFWKKTQRTQLSVCSALPMCIHLCFLYVHLLWPPIWHIDIIMCIWKISKGVLRVFRILVQFGGLWRSFVQFWGF